MTHDDYINAGLSLEYDVSVFTEDGDEIEIKYSLQPQVEDGIVTEVYVSTDWEYDFSFKVNFAMTARDIIKQADELIQDSWLDENF